MVSIALAESGGDIGARYNPEGNTGGFLWIMANQYGS